jgi:uncharacterized protein YndB with AHSA1/START domain
VTNPASLAAAMILLVCAPAVAEVRQPSPDGAVIEHRFQISAAPDAAWRALAHPELWWPADHTWSGNPANLRLQAEAGGCFCENWGESSAEHGRVVMSRPGELLRMRGAFGPLQELAVTAVLTVELATKDGGTEATVTYRLSGDASHKLDGFAPAVDQVIGLQFGSWARYASQPAVKPAP